MTHRRAACALAASLVLLCRAPEARAWGYVAHRMVVEEAAREVPEPLRGWLAARAARLSDLSLEPDTVLKSADPDEAPRHFFDLDDLPGGAARTGDLPGDLAAARGRFGAARLARSGVLPWWIADRAAALEAAMKGGDGEAILVLAGHLSHYAADLHQPLHLTRNFDGQMTGNDGVHAAFERFLIERSPESFRPRPVDGAPPSRRIEDPARWAIARAAEIFPSARTVLDADTEATRALKKDGADYYRELDLRAGPTARRLLAQAARATAELWTSAWIGAGRPDTAGWRAPARSPGAVRPSREGPREAGEASEGVKRPRRE